MNNHKLSSAVAIAGIVGIVLGGGIGYAASMSMDANETTTQTTQMANTDTATKAADLRVALNNLLREHVSSSLDVTRAIAGGASEADLAGAKAAQTANATAIAEAIGSLYGDEAKAKITTLFVDHIEQSNNYASAVKSGDMAAKEEAQQELNEYLNDIAAFFSEAINDLPKETVYELLSEHESLLNKSVEAYQSGDFKTSYDLERQALTQVSTIADALAKGIVATDKEKF